MNDMAVNNQGADPPADTVAIRPKQGESFEDAVKRLQPRHPGKRLVPASNSSKKRGNPGPKATPGTRKPPPIPGDSMEPAPGKYPTLLDLTGHMLESKATGLDLDLDESFIQLPYEILSEALADQLPRINLADPADLTSLLGKAKKLTAYAIAYKLHSTADEVTQLELRNLSVLFRTLKPSIPTPIAAVIDRLGDFKTDDHWFRIEDKSAWIRRLLAYTGAEEVSPTWNFELFTWNDLSRSIQKIDPVSWVRQQQYTSVAGAPISFPQLRYADNLNGISAFLTDAGRTTLAADLQAVRVLATLRRSPVMPDDIRNVNNSFRQVGSTLRYVPLDDGTIRDRVIGLLPTFQTVQEVLSRSFSMTSVDTFQTTGTAAQLVEQSGPTLAHSPISVAGADMAFGFTFPYRVKVRPISLQQWEYTHATSRDVAQIMFVQTGLK